jgi:hypothetical protein
MCAAIESISRVVRGIRWSSLAGPGGIAGKTAYVVRPVSASTTTIAANRRKSRAERIQRTAARTGVTTKWLA